MPIKTFRHSNNLVKNNKTRRNNMQRGGMDTTSTSYSDGGPPTLALPMYSTSQSHGSGGAGDLHQSGSISHHPLTSANLAQHQQYQPVHSPFPSLASSQHSSGSSSQVEIAAEGEETPPTNLPMGNLNSITLTQWLNTNKTNKNVVELQNAIIEKIQIENAKWLLRYANDSLKTLIATKMTKKERNDNPPSDLLPPVSTAQGLSGQVPHTSGSQNPLPTTQTMPGTESTLHTQMMPVQDEQQQYAPHPHMMHQQHHPYLHPHGHQQQGQVPGQGQSSTLSSLTMPVQGDQHQHQQQGQVPGQGPEVL